MLGSALPRRDICASRGQSPVFDQPGPCLYRQRQSGSIDGQLNRFEVQREGTSREVGEWPGPEDPGEIREDGLTIERNLRLQNVIHVHQRKGMEGHQVIIEGSAVDMSPALEDTMIAVQAVHHLHPVQDPDREIDEKAMEHQAMVVTRSLQEIQTDQRKTTTAGNLKMEPEMVRVLLRNQRRKNQPTTQVPIKMTNLSQPLQLQLKPRLST